MMDKEADLAESMMDYLVDDKDKQEMGANKNSKVDSLLHHHTKDSILKTANIRSPSPKNKADLHRKLKVKMQNKEEMEILKSQPLFLDKQGIPDKIQKNIIKDNLQKRIRLKMMQKGEKIPEFQVPNESRRESGFRSISPTMFYNQGGMFPIPSGFVSLSPPMQMVPPYGMNYQVPIAWQPQFVQQAAPQYNIPMNQMGYNAYYPAQMGSDPMLRPMSRTPSPYFQADPQLLQQISESQMRQYSQEQQQQSQQQFQQFQHLQQQYSHNPQNTYRQQGQGQGQGPLSPIVAAPTAQSRIPLTVSITSPTTSQQAPILSPTLRSLLSPDGTSNALFGLDNQQINALFPTGILSPISLSSQFNLEQQK